MLRVGRNLVGVLRPRLNLLWTPHYVSVSTKLSQKETRV